jgi:hypothetical protein
MVWVTSCILNRASNESYLSRQPNRLRHDFRRVAKPLLQIRGDGQVRRLDNRTRVCQSFISRQAAVSSAENRRRGCARRGQGRKSKTRENAGGTDVPGIRNYEGARAVMKGAKASCLFFLGDTHGVYLPIRNRLRTVPRLACLWAVSFLG